MVWIPIRNVFKWIGHVQIADVPTRGRPETSEVHRGNVFDVLAEAAYNCFIDLGYDPGVSFYLIARIPRSACSWEGRA
jgi:hydroxypyruvate isomerase